MKHLAVYIGIAAFCAVTIWMLFFSRPGEAFLVTHVGGPAWAGVLMLVAGVGFFASYVFQKATFAKPFLFICQHFSSPSSDKMALFYGVLLSISGSAVVINALSSSAV
ncbi:hypothetical protein [Marinobacter sp. JSM 1782161]|uniref:hypothetical protein n=1 Tax=Marinobacter sp. JSM 1782161 TaxID=2685906 RepID=UPI001401E49C|nr:hypothetical protein [Marinobacter sp. JSM 1782161]